MELNFVYLNLQGNVFISRQLKSVKLTLTATTDVNKLMKPPSY